LELQRQIDALRNQFPSTERTGTGSPTISLRHAETETASTEPMETEPMETETSQASIPSHQTLDFAAGPATTMTTSTRTPADEAVATEVGYLTLTATGEARYLGSSSGMGLAELIGSVLDSQTVVSNPPGEKNGDLGGRCSPQPTCLPGDAPIPPRETADEFINSYFEHIYITFPLLYRGSFLAAV